MQPGRPTLIAGHLASLRLKLAKRSFLSDIALLVGGATFSQAVSVLASPLLTRLFTPRDYGVLAVFSSALAILAIVAVGRYEVTIPLPRQDSDASSLVGLCLFVTLLVTLITALLTLTLGPAFAHWSHTPELISYLWLLPVAVLGTGLYQIFNYWALRKKNFGAINRTRIAQVIGQLGIQIPGGLLHFGVPCLLAGTLASQVLGTGGLLKRSGLRFQHLKPGEWRRLAKEYRAFPLINSWDALINVIGLRIPHVIFAALASVELAGYYSLTLRVLGLPASLLGQAVAQVFYPTVAEMTVPAARSLIERTATALLLVSFPLFTIVALHGPFLFGWVFGNSWKTSGQFAQYLSPFLMVSFLSSPLSTYTLVRRKQREAFYYGLSVVVLRIGALWAGLRYGSADLAVGMYSLSGTLVYLLYLQFLFRLAGSSIKQWLSQIRPLVLIGPILVAVLIVLSALLPKMLSLILSMMTLTLFSTWLWRFGHAKLASA
jgi:O-antigen/teichoic acid export membrane protein